MWKGGTTYTLKALLIFTRTNLQLKPTMPPTIKKYFGLGQSILAVIFQLRKQRKFLSDEISPQLAHATKSNDGTLSETDLKKITHYYGWAVPAILGEAFCMLRGSKMSEKERRASTCQGAMTGLFDDFFDKDYMEDEKVKAKITTVKSCDLQQSNERLFNVFYESALENVPDRSRMQQALLAVHNAQVKSKKQVDPSLSLKEIQAITEEKGGTSLLFYRTAFLPLPCDKEISLLFHLGATMQLANDIFDVYKDRENNIRTLMTEATKVDTVRNLLTERLQYAYKEAYMLPYHRLGIRKFLNNISIGIFSRSFVCLDHLEKNEKITGDHFDVNAYTRAQLICDMDTKKNMLRSAAYHLETIK